MLVTPSEAAPNADNVGGSGVEVVRVALPVDVEYWTRVNLDLLGIREPRLLRTGSAFSVHREVSHAVVDGVLDGRVDPELACQESELEITIVESETVGSRLLFLYRQTTY